MKKKNILLLVLLLTTLAAQAGIYRHDKKESQYAALAKEPQFDCVGQLIKGDCASGSCVLIGSRHVLTAAHCFIESDHRPETIRNGNQTIVLNTPYNQHLVGAAGFTVIYNGVTYRCKRVTVYPRYLDTATHDGLDVALIELEEEVKGIAPAMINTALNELHADVTGAGYGSSGPADAPDQVASEHKKLAGENVIDSIGGYRLNDEPTTMFCDFDHPTNNECNKMGSATPRPLEYICGGGDSGGGLFRQTRTGWELIGLCHGSAFNVTQLMKTGYYGQTMSWMRISLFKSWITENMK